MYGHLNAHMLKMENTKRAHLQPTCDYSSQDIWGLWPFFFFFFCKNVQTLNKIIVFQYSSVYWFALHRGNKTYNLCVQWIYARSPIESTHDRTKKLLWKNDMSKQYYMFVIFSRGKIFFSKQNQALSWY